MLITKNANDESIIYVTKLSKNIVVYVEKDGLIMFDFTFNNVTKYEKNTSFFHGSQRILSIHHNSMFFKHKLRYDFQTEDTKFYKLTI